MNTLRSLTVISLGLLFCLSILPCTASAQERETPYWASLRYDEVNMRVGPSGEYPIEWVYRRKGMPLKVIRLREGWRLVQDHEGTQGWVAASQLALSPSALVIGEGLAEMHESPSAQSPVRWRAESGVVGELLRCRDGYCEIDVAGRSGWVELGRLWGAGELAPAP